MLGGGKRKAGEDAENMAISKRAALGEITNNTGGNTPPFSKPTDKECCRYFFFSLLMTRSSFRLFLNIL